MKEEISPGLIRRYLDGACTPAEAARVREWYDSFENDEDPLVSLSTGDLETLRKLMYDEVMQRVRSHETPSPRRIFTRGRLLRFVGGAAAAAVAVFFGLRLFFEDPKTPERDGLSVTPEVIAEAAPCADPGRTLVENRLKTILRQTLPDGSVVWLKPDTWISFPAAFEPEKRELKMKGEAFFEVSPDASRPFVVFSGDLMTRVVGTSFNIKAYGDGSPSEVSVFTGKVSVSLPDGIDGQGKGELYLIKDEKAVFRQGEKRLMKQLYSPEVQPELNIWRKNTVSFDNAPVKEVVRVLNAEFDIALKVAESDQELNNYMLKADFTNQNLPDILQMLERSLSLTYEINGKEIILKLDK